jgi:hypothetical protein
MAYSPPPGPPYYGPQQSYAPPYGGPWPPYAQARPTNVLALAALICGIAQFIVGVTFLPAIVCGHIARRQIRRTGDRGDELALAGLILGYVGAVLFAGAVIAVAIIATKAHQSGGPVHRAYVTPIIRVQPYIVPPSGQLPPAPPSPAAPVVP